MNEVNERLRSIIKWSQWPPWAGIEVPEILLVRVTRKCFLCEEERESQVGFYPNFDICIECAEKRESETMRNARKVMDEWTSKATAP
jgi:hypothetical protein